MRKLLAMALLLANVADAQCCLGAQDGEDVADNGRYRVRATSQTGTGPRSHGPYRFAFVFEELDADGAWRAIGSFERNWNTKKHFWMGLCASPTGNGFLLSTSMDRTILLIAPDGRTLRDVRRGKLVDEVTLWRNQERAPHVSVRRGKEGREASLFVPFAEIHDERCWSKDERACVVKAEVPFFTEPESARPFRIAMLDWSEARGRAERPRAEAALVQLGAVDPREQERGEEALLALGLSALAPLNEAITRSAADATALRERLVAVRDRIDQLARGHHAPHRNLDLLVLLLEHPDVELRRAAEERLRQILPEGSRPTADWVREHRDALRWDATTERFLRER